VPTSSPPPPPPICVPEDGSMNSGTVVTSSSKPANAAEASIARASVCVGILLILKHHLKQTFSLSEE
jgi:hypothetical protein